MFTLTIIFKVIFKYLLFRIYPMLYNNLQHYYYLLLIISSFELIIFVQSNSFFPSILSIFPYIFIFTSLLYLHFIFLLCFSPFLSSTFIITIHTNLIHILLNLEHYSLQLVEVQMTSYIFLNIGYNYLNIYKYIYIFIFHNYPYKPNHSISATIYYINSVLFYQLTL